MTPKSAPIKEQIATLEAEEACIEGKTTHQGFRDASRRNRIEEEIADLYETARHNGHSLPDTLGPVIRKNDP